jgi:Superfamily II DNA and RNA helicases
MLKSFDELGISPSILKAIEDMGFDAPTEVQSQAIPHVLNKEDLIVRSKTGSGKTAVFGVPLLQLTDPGKSGPQALILTPTRELAVQVDSDIRLFARHLPHRTTAVYGQHNINNEIQALSRKVTIVTGTPGRVFDHISHGTLITKNISYFVLDEADRMLDMGFLDQVARIMRTLPKNRVTLLFSATIPEEVHNICREYMKNPVTIEIESHTMTVDTTQQIYYRVQPNEKYTQLNRILLMEQPESCVIFCNTRIAVDKVHNFLSRQGYATQALHGDIPQVKRLKTLNRFKSGEFHLLVATDVAARGIHVDDLALVINYDVPIEKDGYVHRIGRTGRAGHGGRAISLVTGDDIMSLYEIEEHIGTLIEEQELPSEDEFREYAVSADRWIKANTKRNEPPRLTDHKPGKTQNKRPYQKNQQRNSRPKERLNGENNNYNRTTQTERTAAVKQDTPILTVVKPAAVVPGNKDGFEIKRSQDIIPGNQPASKPPLLHRLMQRLFGWKQPDSN